MDDPHGRVVTVRTSCSKQAVMYIVLSPLACHTMCWHLPTDEVGNPYRCPAYFVNDHNRLSTVECGFIQHVSVGILSSYSPGSPVSCVSNQLRESLRATTAPITVMAGDVMFALLAHSAIFTSVSVTTRCCGMVPCWITAAGVSEMSAGLR